MHRDAWWGLRLLTCSIVAGLIVGTGLAVALGTALQAVTPLG